MNKPLTCDIFCSVVDNFGDIGVCWRLAHMLAHEHHLEVRLWVDDWISFHRLCPEIDPARSTQRCMGIEVRKWDAGFTDIQPAQWVIESFACNLPEPYLAAMAGLSDKPVWIALEHLSAEDWVSGCHRVPSPHPVLPLTKYYFFPGFTRGTGGLMLEHDLLARRDVFQGDVSARVAWWHSMGVPPPNSDGIYISLFCYENSSLQGLLEAWSKGQVPVCCLVPEGRVVPTIARHFGRDSVLAGNLLQRGQLKVCILPFMRQDDYDMLLWACDINFVRGEDSFVRAQWAANPLVWHIYPQQDGVHHQKLQAFMARYETGLTAEARAALYQFWEAWNKEGDAAAAWPAFAAQREVLRRHTRAWAENLSHNNLVLNLLDFFREIGKIRAFQF